ncbi:uncharacterized protein LOC120350267 [Nilaparvata lugens]|uniref:uncharacterized protein LOC120350267 n=1 Tax=Nilaparvata lugens TaxID=108931 RepID=UPI00193D739F|nr:uncharacterized protein LOC120350267 [Nilaparvata lugens]
MASGKRPHYHAYSVNSMSEALKSIHEDKISVQEASHRFGVPRTSIQDRLSGKVSLQDGSWKMGPDPVLSKEEELKLATWLEDLAKSGFPRKPDDLLNSVQQIVKATKKERPFVDGRPGKKWYENFMRHHPQLVRKTPESLTKGRALITEELIRKWFRELEEYLDEIGQKDILKEPDRILNGDETSFSMCPKTGKVIAPKGWRNLYDIKMGNEKETVTVLLVFTASGRTLVPMIVFPFVKPPKLLSKACQQASETGWMRSELFYEYVANGVDSWLRKENIKKPVLLFVDGHKSHLTLELSQFCSDNGIILYALPPKTTILTFFNQLM